MTKSHYTSLCGIICFLIGSAIYLFFRKELPSLMMYKWIALVGGTDIISKTRQVTLQIPMCDFVVYSLPDGLFCLSYIMIMDSIWQKSNKFFRSIIVLFIPIICIVHESLQGIGYVRGTFDIFDFVCYIVPISVYLVAYL